MRLISEIEQNLVAGGDMSDSGMSDSGGGGGGGGGSYALSSSDAAALYSDAGYAGNTANVLTAQNNSSVALASNEIVSVCQTAQAGFGTTTKCLNSDNTISTTNCIQGIIGGSVMGVGLSGGGQICRTTTVPR